MDQMTTDAKKFISSATSFAPKNNDSKIKQWY